MARISEPGAGARVPRRHMPAKHQRSVLGLVVKLAKDVQSGDVQAAVSRTIRHAQQHPSEARQAGQALGAILHPWERPVRPDRAATRVPFAPGRVFDPLRGRMVAQERGVAQPQPLRIVGHKHPLHSGLTLGDLIAAPGAAIGAVNAAASGLQDAGAALGHDLPKELQGTGAAERGLSTAGAWLAENLPLANQTGDYTGLSQEYARNTIRDAFDIPAQAVPSVYIPARQAVTGHPGEALHTLADPVKESLVHPTKHPLGTLLILRGGEALVGRGAGAAMRSGALGEGAARAASTARAPLRLTGRMEEQRHYSPDVFEKGAQVALEKRRARKGKPVNQAVGRELDAKLQRRGDAEVDASEKIRRANRARVATAEEQALPKGNTGRLVPFIVEKTVRRPDTVAHDLLVRKQRLQAAQAGLRGGELADNRRMVQQIGHILADTKLLEDPSEAFTAAHEYVARQKEMDAALIGEGHIVDAQAQRAPLVPYAVQHMGASDHLERGLVDEHGTPLSNDVIRAHMRENGVDPNTVGFFSQRPGLEGARSYFVNSQRRPRVASQSRTGESTRLGTYAASRQTLIDQQVRSQGYVDAAQAVNRVINLAGVRPTPNGFFRSMTEASREVRRLAEQNPHAPEMVPFDVAAAFTPREHLGVIRSQLHPGELADHAERFGLNIDAALHGSPGGQFVLLPRVLVDRMRQHQQVSGGGSGGFKAFQAVTQAFRHTVLPLSSKWLFGNVAEMSLRLGLAHGLRFPVEIPRSYIAGRRVVKGLGELDPVKLDELRARALAGVHFSSARNLDVHRSAEQFDGALRTLASSLGAVARAPGPKQIGIVWKAYRDTVFRLNTLMEHQGAITALGHEARLEWRELNGSWLKAMRFGDQAVRDTAKGLLNTEAQVRYARAIDDTLGRYSKLSPDLRRWITGYMPFGLWTMNALKFVTLTVPRYHPVAAGLVAAAYAGTEKERLQRGLSEFAPSDVKVPGFLQGTIPVAGGHVRLSGYTPFGLFSDLPENVASGILPQASGIFHEWQGLNWKNGTLRLASGQEPDETTRLLLGLYATAESTVPLLAIGRTLRERGGSSYDDSTIFSPKTRPGTRGSVLGALNRRFNPLAVTPTSQKRGGSGARPLGGGLGSSLGGSLGGGLSGP